MPSMAVLLEAFEPLPSTLALNLPSEATAADILAGIQQALSSSSSSHDGDIHSLYLTSAAAPGRVLAPSTRPLEYYSDDEAGSLKILRLHARTLGGKGGFGSMLRAAGGKMSAKQGQGNTDSCRDLNGRRLSVMKEAKALATYIENEPARLKALNEAQQRKYAKLERMLGRQPKAAADFEEAARRLADAQETGEEQASASDGDDGEHERGQGSSKSSGGGAGIGSRSSRPVTTPSATTSAGVKRKERLEDQEYVEQSREIVDNVRNAVAAAMMKKRKKAKTASTSASASTTPGKVATAAAT